MQYSYIFKGIAIVTNSHQAGERPMKPDVHLKRWKLKKKQWTMSGFSLTHVGRGQFIQCLPNLSSKRREWLSCQINAGTQGTARDLLAAQETALQQEDPLGLARGEIR